jgi:glycosyltransferase involved in cell wall biosynthesis
MVSFFLVVFYIAVGVQCMYYVLFTSPLFFKKKKCDLSTIPISVIICAKNEAVNLRSFLPSIIKQNYKGSFEIVVINDRSTDETAEVIDEFSKTYDCIKVVTINDCESFWGNKKYALTLGIKAASHEHLLFTDADCKPKNDHWIQEMASNFSDSKRIVLGYGGYQKVKGSFLNKIIRYETILTAVQYFSYAKIGLPYMGVGRNLAYTKTDFFKVNGFIKHVDIKSGDDDLFINEVASSKNTTFNLEKESFTESVPKLSLKEWIIQKRRHISTASHYKTKHKAALGLFYISQIVFFILAVLLLIITEEKEAIFLLISIRYLIVLISLGMFSSKLLEKDLIIFLPFTEIILIFLQLYIYLKNKTAAPVQWH